MNTRMLVRVAIVIAALSTAGAASTAAVVLPDKANSHAVDSTSTVTTGSSSDQGTNPGASAEPSAAEAAAYGQCVANNATTASDNGGQGWNPTVGCENANAGAQSGDTSAQDGRSVAAEHANSNASTGLGTAADAGSNGADNAAAQAGNAP
jgi:hypothetical protein